MPNIFCISLIASGKGQCRHGLMTSASTSVAKVGPFIKKILSRGRSWWIKTSVSLQAAGRPIPGTCSPPSGVTPKYYCPLSFFPQLRPLRGSSSPRTRTAGPSSICCPCTEWFLAQRPLTVSTSSSSADRTEPLGWV